MKHNDWETELAKINEHMEKHYPDFDHRTRQSYILGWLEVSYKSMYMDLPDSKKAKPVLSNVN